MKKNTLLFLSLTFIFLLQFIPFQQLLIIEDGETGDLITYYPLKPRYRTFSIQYTHSIHLSEVRETYKVLRDDTIRQVELEYSDLAVGMPSNAEKDEIFEFIDGTYFIKNMKRDFTSIHMRTLQVADNHQIQLNDRSISFSTIVKPGSLIILKVKKVNLWEMWRGVKIIE